MAGSGATEYMTQDSFHLEDYTPPAPGHEVESAGGCFLPVAEYGRLRLLVDPGTGTFKEATRELTVDRVGHVPNLGRHNLLSTKRLTTAFDAPIGVPSRRSHSTPFRLQDARFPLLMSRNWLPPNQGPPSRRYEAAANAANGSAIDSDSQGDHNPSISWCHAGPSAPCSASTLTTHDEPFASVTSPPAKSSCFRRPYGTPQPKRQFSVTRRLKGGRGWGRDTGIIRRDPKTTSHYMSSLESREAVSKKPESEPHGPKRAGGSEGVFELERVEHDMGGVFRPKGKS